MRVTDVKLTPSGDAVELSALVDDYRLWYRFPAGYTISTRGDPFLAASLLPAMSKGEPLEIDPGLPVSPKLVEGVDRIQDAFRMWYSGFQKIPIRAASAPAEPGNAGVAQFFSGGVDSSYTFLKRAEEISHLIFIKGIDMQLDNDALFTEVLAANRGFADGFGKRLLPIVTNFRQFCHARGIGWNTYQGGAYASIALALGFPRTYLSATHTYAQLKRLGSHPLTDPWWSSEAVQVIHEGAEAQRSEKLVRISACEPALRILRVCWQDRGYNCGRCPKCLQTMVTLRLLGVTAPRFPPLPGIAAVKQLQVEDDGDQIYFEDNLDLALRRNDRAMARALRRCIVRYELKKMAVNLDRVLFKGAVKRLYQRALGLRERPPAAPGTRLPGKVKP
jgi:hypothetical protein